MSDENLDSNGGSGTMPPPPPTPDTRPAEPDDRDGKMTMTVAVGTATTGGDQTFINHQQNLQLVADSLDQDIVSIERPFSAKDAPPCDEQPAEEIEKTFVGDDAVITRLLRDVEERRVLLVTGERFIGKRTTALYVSLRLRAAHEGSEWPLIVESLERKIGINLRDVAADRTSFGGRTTVFIDAFEQRNRQLHAFFNGANSATWTQVRETLKRNHAYLVFTSATASAPFRDDVRDHVACHELQPLTPALIDKGFRERLKWMASLHEAAAERTRVLAKHHEKIIAELKTLPRIASFASRFVRDDADLETALRRFRDVPYWFQTTLDRDPDAWSFVTSIALAQSARDSDTAAWADFDRLRRAVHERLRTDVDLYATRRKRDGQEDLVPPSLLPTLADQPLLARCRAVIDQSPDRLGDVIRFDHASLTAEVWESLLRHHRRALMSILPVLRSIAEDNRDASEWSLRSIAAQAIGRLGELDPVRIAVPLILKWAASGERMTRPLVGRLMQGILGSKNENYQNLALRHIELLADPRGQEDDGVSAENLLTAISAYGQIGVYAPELAMARIGAIVIDSLTPVFQDVQQLARAIDRAGSREATVRSRRAANGLRARRLRLSELAERLFARQAPALLAVEQTVSYLCFVHDPIQILRFMHSWISRGGEKTGILVALLFLKDGIAADLQTPPATVRAVTGSAASSLLLSLAATRHAVRQFAGFLAALHTSIHALFVVSTKLQGDLIEQLGVCLTTCVRETVNTPDHRATVENLFVTLAGLRGRTLHDDVVSLLESDAFTSTQFMRSFAASVMPRIEQQARERRQEKK